MKKVYIKTIIKLKNVIENVVKGNRKVSLWLLLCELYNLTKTEKVVRENAKRGKQIK